jgi:hypothetical protein
MAEAHRVKLSFAVPGPGGYMRIVHEGDWLKADDPLVRTHREYLQAGGEYVEQMTSAPGEVRATKVPEKGRRFGRRNQGEEDMPHSLPPEHEDSPASAFAPFQPGAGVVADDKADVPEQNPGKGISAKDADKKYAGKDMPPVGDAVEGEDVPAADTDKSEGKPLKSTKG